MLRKMILKQHKCTYLNTLSPVRISLLGHFGVDFENVLL